MEVSSVLMACAYVLLIVTTVSSLSGYSDFSWELVPTWLVLAGYSASVLKSLGTTKESKERYEQVTLLAWFTYYTLCIIWPFPLHWYDGLAMASLFVRGQFLGNALMSAYYAITAAAYADDALQVSARLLLVGLSSHAALQTMPRDMDDTRKET